MYQISARLKHTYESYTKCEKKNKEKTKKKIFNEILLTRILRDLLKFEICPPPCVEEANSTVNLVSFGKGIVEVWMHENHDFVVPVNILTPFVRPPFSWAARHTTVCLDNHTSSL